MRRLFAALILLSAISTPSLAQPGAEPPPPGSYWQSCQSVAVQGSGADATLSAQCRTREGQWRATNLRYRQCRYEIESINGQLSCGGLSEQGSTAQPIAAELPQGNYAKSCRGAIAQGFGYEAALSAQCQTRDGRWRSSTLRYANCRFGIENIDGQLTCAAQGQSIPAANQQEVPPPGNYWQTCQNVVIQGYGRDATLNARCETRDGRARSTSLRYKNCRNPVENIDGQLICENGGTRPPYGSGYGQGGNGSNGYSSEGYGETITLFEGPNYAGAPFTSDREITNIPRQYNDRALSLRVGRSAWQVCSDSDFRGHCETIDRDVRDLRQYGLGRSISSMRPID